jgi:hypothetical protein
LDSDGANEQKTTTTALATLLAGTGLTASSSVIGVDAAQTQITSVGTIGTGVWEGTTIAVAQGGTGATSLSNLITLSTHTTGNYVATVTAGTNLTSSGATTGEGIAHSLSVDDAFLKNDASDVTTGTVTSAGFVLADAANVSISVPLLANADHTTTGITAEMLAGGAISAFDLVCIGTTTGEVIEADASAVGTARVIGIAPVAISDTATGTVLLQGFIRDDDWNWTTGSPLYLSETAGAMTHTAPTTDGAFVQVVGVALEPDVVYFNPSMDVIEHA